jgi:hypothetical protein
MHSVISILYTVHGVVVKYKDSLPDALVMWGMPLKIILQKVTAWSNLHESSVKKK